jgi:hypothetical protein
VVRPSSLVAALVAVAALASCSWAIRPRMRMCDAATSCADGTSCVAGRCQKDGAVASIQASRRILLEPVDVAYVRRGDSPSGGSLPAIFALGRNGLGDAALLLRFSASLPPDAAVVEAYVLLERSDAMDADPVPIALHAARIVEQWDPRVVTWATGPRLEETRSPSSLVPPAGRALVRVDVRAMVQKWHAHDPLDQGIAIVAENSSTTGIAFASGRLELYVK